MLEKKDVTMRKWGSLEKVNNIVLVAVAGKYQNDIRSVQTSHELKGDRDFFLALVALRPCLTSKWQCARTIVEAYPTETNSIHSST